MHPSSVDQDDIFSISVDCLVYKVAEYGENCHCEFPTAHSVFNDKQFMLCSQMSTWDEGSNNDLTQGKKIRINFVLYVVYVRTG